MSVGVERDAGEAAIHPRRRLGDARAERPPTRDGHGDVRFASGMIAISPPPGTAATPYSEWLGLSLGVR